MLKEIHEQPRAVMDTINPYLEKIELLDEYKLDKYDHITIIGCGSAYHVGLVGKSLIMKYGKVNVDVDIASEYRYNEHVYGKKELIILISQSGETADTLAVLRRAKEEGVDTLAIVNVVGSSIAREANNVIYIKAGPEIAVATTKAYMCQLAILSIIACYLGIKRHFGHSDRAYWMMAVCCQLGGYTLLRPMHRCQSMDLYPLMSEYSFREFREITLIVQEDKNLEYRLGPEMLSRTCCVQYAYWLQNLSDKHGSICPP